MTGEPLQQIQAQAKLHQQTLWEFLMQVPGSMEGQIFIALMLSGTLGVFAHYFHKWLHDEISGNLFSYLFMQYPRRTLLSFSAYVAWVVGLVGTGLFTTPSGEFVGWGVVMILGFTNGYGVDSLANKGKRTEWSPEERNKVLGASDSGRG